MRNPSVVALSKDYSEDPTSNHHVLREMAKTRRVLWLNSLGTRTPKLGNARDLGKLRRKLTEFAKGPIEVEPNLWVMTPLVLPLPHVPAAQRANRAALAAMVRWWTHRLSFGAYDLWTFLPTTAPYVGHLGETFSAYYCVDEWSLFSNVDGAHVAAAERELLGRVDATFAINSALADNKRAHCPHTFEAPHGVAYDVFRAALEPSLATPADIAHVPRPHLGFYGTLQDWVDYELLAHVARAMPHASIILLGQVLADVGPIANLPNVHILGQRPHAALPAYCKSFDVGLIPYKQIERMKYVNPIKLREYLAAGLPVVTTPLTSAAAYPLDVTIANTPTLFVSAIAAALDAARQNNARSRVERSLPMARESWSARVATVLAQADSVRSR
ncbi:MAG: glycosyltransferase [Myxococcales bacterium]|nr:glycosyltransferase [Myxococcales bacterium]